MLPVLQRKRKQKRELWHVMTGVSVVSFPSPKHLLFSHHRNDNEIHLVKSLTHRHTAPRLRSQDSGRGEAPILAVCLRSA